MIARTLLAALVAGLIAGVFMTLAQQYRTVPLIVHAEKFEHGAGHDHASEQPASSQTLPGHESHDHAGGGDGAQTLFGLDRFSGTLFANLVIGAGFGLLLSAASLATGRAITAANGVLWGSAGWLAVHLLPAIGLPPELPGFPAADLGARQVWWSMTILLSAVGLGLVLLATHGLARIGGVVLIAIPHVIGAPQPADISSTVPALLAAEFAVAALATGLLFWVVLGLMLGAINDRFERSNA